MHVDDRIDTRYARWVFGRAIRQGRISAGLSQRGLASRAGLNQSTISRLECGTLGGMRYETLMRVLDGMGIRDVHFLAKPLIALL